MKGIQKRAGLSERWSAAKREGRKGAITGGGLSAAHLLYDEDSPREVTEGLDQMRRALSKDDPQKMWGNLGRGSHRVLSDLGGKALPGATAGALVGGAKGMVFPNGVLNTAKDGVNKVRGGPEATRKPRPEEDRNPDDIWQGRGPME